MKDKATALSRIVGVEEHVGFPELARRLPEAALIERGFLSRDKPFGKASLTDQLTDVEGRISKLDAAGVRVVSLGVV